MWESGDDEVASASLLLNSSGVRRQIFPKSYRIKLTWGFYLYLFALTAFVFSYTAVLYALGDGTVSPLVFVFDAVYMIFLIAFIFWQVPRTVIRENDRILVRFCCRTRAVPLDTVLEIRILHARKCTSAKDCCKGLLCRYPTKFFWGYPTNFDRNVLLVTSTSCNNYIFSLHEMDEFVRDNWPEQEAADQADGDQVELGGGGGAAAAEGPTVLGAATAL
eukprot:TRINITY_DN14205_c1_g1_i1.p1 TRINITY_DN14205_c1_g1~~TRINITY_DN14205_c1_g1_i1.p1  ORF type:complete len:257 (-),score=34.53 TRINITY_DN14205_c1_g1_i1:31-687(-)